MSPWCKGLILIVKVICNVRGSCLRHWNSSSQFWILISNLKYELVFFACFGKLSHDIPCDKVEWSRYWSELQFTTVAILWVPFCAVRDFADNIVEVYGQVESVKRRRIVLCMPSWSWCPSIKLMWYHESFVSVVCIIGQFLRLYWVWSNVGWGPNNENGEPNSRFAHEAITL